MIDKERIARQFVKLVSIDAPSYREREMADYLTKELEENENGFFLKKHLKYFGTLSDRADRLMSREGLWRQLRKSLCTPSGQRQSAAAWHAYGYGGTGKRQKSSCASGRKDHKRRHNGARSR